jgi:hypothetical protein
MKRQTYRRLLVAVGVILLIGLVASCDEKSEPRFKVIESMTFIAATQNSVGNTLTNKHLSGMTPVNDNTGIFNQYRSEVMPLIEAELQKKDPAYGLYVIIKADNYRIRYRAIWKTKPNYEGGYTVYQ